MLEGNICIFIITSEFEQDGLCRLKCFNLFNLKSLSLGNSWKLDFFFPCIESRGDWAPWSTSPLPFCYRIWQVWNPDLVLFSISTGILEVRLFFVLLQCSWESCTPAGIEIWWFLHFGVWKIVMLCCTYSCFAVLLLKNFANCLKCKICTLFRKRDGL